MDARRTPLYDQHEALGARLTEFGGWSMPVTFESIREEHRAVRTEVGKFDVSHMGEIEVAGPDATELMQRLTSNDVTRLEVGRAQYAAITDEDGIMLEDTIITRLVDDADGSRYLFVPNAGNNASMASRWTDHRDAWGLDATVNDRTDELAMIAVQGPDSQALLDPLVDADLGDVKRFATIETAVADTACSLSRTGYTGEDGFELLVDWSDASAVWEAIDCTPCGLGARDTLRLEAGLLLRGNEFHPESNPRNPIEAGISFAVDLETSFVGRDALEEVARDGPRQRLVGISMTGRGIPRTGYDITDAEGTVIGTVTSGTQSPTLDVAIGMGYVDSDQATPDNGISVSIRDRLVTAKIESLPFVE